MKRVSLFMPIIIVTIFALSIFLVSCSSSGDDDGGKGDNGAEDHLSAKIVQSLDQLPPPTQDTLGYLYYVISEVKLYYCNGTEYVFIASGQDALSITWLGALAEHPSNPELTDSILWNGGDEIWHNDGSTVTITYSCVQDDDTDDGSVCPGEGNIDDYPEFVLGPFGYFYLDQTGAGQPADSPCVDAGSDTAEDLGLSELTTRNDSEPDDGTVDMGYHHPLYEGLYITWISRSGNDITIHWSAEAGVSYTVEWSTDMTTWTDILVGETNTWTDVGGALQPQRYYRIREE